MRFGSASSLSAGGLWVPGGVPAAVGPAALATFSALTPGAQASALPGGWLISCATAGTTCRTSSSTLATGIAADTARVDVTPGGSGLLVEPASANVLRVTMGTTYRQAHSYAQGPSGATFPTTVAGPDGSVVADEIVVTAGGYSKYDSFTVGGSAALMSYSGWYRAISGTSVPRSNLYIGQNGMVDATPVGTVWERRELVQTRTGTVVFLPTDTRPSGLASDIVFDLPQIEAISQVTSHMPGGTRAGTRLYHPDRSAFVVGGRVKLALQFVALCEPNKLDADAVIWSDPLDPTNYNVRIVAASGKLKATIAGSSYTLPVVLSWRVGDVVTLYVEAGAGPSAAWYRVGTSPAVDVGQSPTSYGSISGTGAIEVGCSGTANQLPAAVQSIGWWS